jgi:hypothetical protein
MQAPMLRPAAGCRSAAPISPTSMSLRAHFLSFHVCCCNAWTAFAMALEVLQVTGIGTQSC